MQTKRGTRLWPGVLGCILERLDAAEVHRGLDLGREAPEAVGVQLSRGGELPARRGERIAKAGTGEQRGTSVNAGSTAVFVGGLSAFGPHPQDAARWRRAWP